MSAESVPLSESEPLSFANSDVSSGHGQTSSGPDNEAETVSSPHAQPNCSEKSWASKEDTSSSVTSDDSPVKPSLKAPRSVIKSVRPGSAGSSPLLPSIHVTQTSTNGWVRMIDDDNHVYYYNENTGQSEWLAPCFTCSKVSARWCTDCRNAFCLDDYTSFHSRNEFLAKHEWSTHEVQKETLKDDEVHCISCKYRVATKICTTCWDCYCNKCFPAVHCAGDLMYHISVAYRRAKIGWICVKGHGKEPDHYINGATNEKTTEKPHAMMTELERVNLKNYQTHLEASKKNKEYINQLREELSLVQSQRDSLILEQFAAGKEAAALEEEKIAASSKRGASIKLLPLFGSSKRESKTKS